MPNNYRIAKVSSLLKKEITLILQNDLQNDLLRGNFIHISKIDLKADLQFCKIYVTSSAEEKIRKEIVENLNLSKNFIRQTLGQRIVMRRVPEITFIDDTSPDGSAEGLKASTAITVNPNTGELTLGLLSITFTQGDGRSTFGTIQFTAPDAGGTRRTATILADTIDRCHLLDPIF